MDSKTYWEQREAENLKNYITDEAEYSKHIDKIYANMLDGINGEIERFYGKYADTEGISLAEAKKRVSQLDINAYERKAQKYVEAAQADMKRYGRDYKNQPGSSYYFGKQANDEMRLYNATMKINRLEMLKANIGLEMVKGHAELETFMGGILQGRTEDELRRQAGILGDTIRDNAKAAHAIVNGSWRNGTFSDRIWQYQDIMRQDLGRILQTGLIQGKNPRALAKDLRQYWYGADPATGGGARYCMERLMRTELARVQTEAQKLSFERMDFDEYTFHANGGCCDACQSKDGKHFKVKDMMPGENAAPMHPNCRCSCSAYEDSDEYEAWLDHLSNGGTTEEWNAMKAGNGGSGGKGGKGSKPLSYEDMKKQIADDRKRISDLDNERWELDKKISEYQRKEKQFAGFGDLQKQEIRSKINALDDRISELNKINDRWYNRPERGTPEYTEWREWRRTVDPDFMDDLLRLTDERTALSSKLSQWDDYEAWKKWKQDNPIDKLNADRAALADEINVLKTKVAENEKQIIGKQIAHDLDNNGVERRAVNKHRKTLSDDEIIEALSGGDMTQGSCASVGLAYIGQKGGLNVLDFRDGKSRQFFSNRFNLDQVAKLPGAKTTIEYARSPATAGNKLLKQVETGKEYYLVVGRHASIVRKTGDGVLQYLELQSSYRSGWTNFDGNPRYTLKTRFGCTGSGYDASGFMIEVDSLKDSKDLKDLLEYINTADDKQRKGKHGTIK